MIRLGTDFGLFVLTLVRRLTNVNINATLFAQIIVFFGLVWFTMKFVWPPIAKALDERAAKIAEGLAAAERGKSDFEQAEKKVAELLAEGRNQVSEMVANAEKRAAKNRRRSERASYCRGGADYSTS